VDAGRVQARYRRLTAAISRELIASAYPVIHGGLGIALAKVAIAGRLGMDIVIPAGMRPDYYLFSESLGRFVVTVSHNNREAFEQAIGPDAVLLGEVNDRAFRVTGEQTLIDLPINELETAYRSPFRGY
jgi:phosphoribosylformylglycinamidine synthase